VTMKRKLPFFSSFDTSVFSFSIGPSAMRQAP
jgi:hypothetical protein